MILLVVVTNCNPVPSDLAFFEARTGSDSVMLLGVGLSILSVFVVFTKQWGFNDITLFIMWIVAHLMAFCFLSFDELLNQRCQ